MAANVGELSVKLGFDVDEKTLQTFTNNIQNLSGKMLGLVGISGLSAAGIGAFARGAYDNAQSIKSLASQTNISAESLQRYGAIANALNPSIDTSSAIKSIVDLDKAWNLYRTTGQGSINFNAASRLGVDVGNKTSLEYIQALHEKYKGITDPKSIQLLSQNLQQLNIPPEFVASIIASDDKLKDVSDKTALTAKELEQMAAYSERIAAAWGDIGHSFSELANNDFIATTIESFARIMRDIASGNWKDIGHIITHPNEGPGWHLFGGNKKSSSAPISSTTTGGGIAAQYAAAGYSPTAIAAIMGNIQQESRGNPDAVNPTSGAYGLYQYLGPRLKALRAKYGNHPTAAQQTQFAIDELNGNGQYGTLGKFLRSGKGSFQQDTSAFMNLFEVPNDNSLGKRLSAGQQYASANNIKIDMNIQSNNPHQIAQELQQTIKQTLSQTNNADNY